MTEPIILAENEDQTRVYVQLQADHDIDYSGAASLIVTADLSEYGAKIHRISSGSKPKDMRLDAVAMDALAAAWLDLRAKQDTKAKAEQERQEKIIAEAYALAAKYPAITIERRDGYYAEKFPAWIVSIPSLNWGHFGPVGTPEDLLSLTKSAADVCQRHMQTHKATA